MTAEAFEALLHWLDPDDRERAGQLYEDLRRRLVCWFRRRGCEDAEDLTDETLDRVARRIEEKVVIHAADPFNYACGVALRVYLEYLRRPSQKRRVLDREPPTLPEWPDDPEEDQRLECLGDCLRRLPEEQRRLILRYHGEDDRIHGRQELARELGIEMNALRIRAHRLRRDLEACVDDCMSLHRH